MCGITAVALVPGTRSATTWREIRETLTRDLLFNETRGHLATGLAIIQADGSTLLHKQPITASLFVQTPTYRELLNTIGSSTTLVLAHTRWPTQGAVDNPDNNHPIESGPVLGVHNGHIENDADLFAHLRLVRRAEVDSEIIFQLLAQHSPDSSTAEYLQLIGQDLQQLHGPSTFLAIDRRRPDRFFAFKHDNPLCLHYHAEWQALLFSSEYLFLRQTFGRSVAAEELIKNQLTYFDVTRLPALRGQSIAQYTLPTIPRKVAGTKLIGGRGSRPSIGLDTTPD